MSYCTVPRIYGLAERAACIDVVAGEIHKKRDAAVESLAAGGCAFVFVILGLIEESAEYPPSSDYGLA